VDLESREKNLRSWHGREPIAQHDPEHRTRIASRVLLPQRVGWKQLLLVRLAARAAASHALCGYGPDGDPNPAMVLADIALRSWRTGRESFGEFGQA